MTLYTIGHGYETSVDFTYRLSRHGVTELADVRSFPGSRRSPQFNKERMPDWLAEAGIAYSHWAALGGRRKPPKERIPEDRWWENESFANYAAHTRTDEFLIAYHDLLRLAESHHVAVMCGEPCYFRCHRRMISDMAVNDGIEVRHIMPNGTIKLHEASGWLTQDAPKENAS